MIRRALLAAMLGMSLVAGTAASAVSQRATKIDVYRFIIGVDVPEPPALVVMGIAPAHVLRGAAPKPIAAGVAAVAGGPAAAIDVSPFFLAGGGHLRLDRWRSMSLGGRLRRVLAKTILSLAATPARGDSSALFGIALRSTIHDPHDPTLSSSVPDDLGTDSLAADDCRCAAGSRARSDSRACGRRAGRAGLGSRRTPRRRRPERRQR